MTRGTPDGRIETQQFAAQVSDVAHVNNMLWGFSPIDGKGRVLYLDTFNNGLSGWRKDSSGAALDPYVSIPSDYAFSPPAVCLLDCGVTSGHRSFLYRDIFAGKSERLGFEIGFKFTNSIIPQIELSYKLVAGTAYGASLGFSQTNGFYIEKTASFTKEYFYNPGSFSGGLLMQIKLVADFAAGKYVRAYIGDQDFDLSAFTLTAPSVSYAGYLAATIWNESKGAGATALALGYALITKDEP